MVRTLILPTKYLINPYFVWFTCTKVPFNTVSPNHHLKHHFSGRSVDSKPWSAMLMNLHGGSDWSILRLSLAFYISMWNRWQRMGWRKEKVREELGEGWGSFISDLTFHLCLVHENWGCLRALGPSWEHRPTESSGSQAFSFFLSFHGVAKLRNEMWRLKSQYCSNLLSTAHLLDECNATELGAPLQECKMTSSLYLPHGNNIFNYWLNCKCPMSHLNKSHMYEIVNCVLTEIPSCKNRATRNRFFFSCS